MRFSRREWTIAVGLMLAFAVPLTVTLLLTGSQAAPAKPEAKATEKAAAVAMHRLCCRSTPMTPPRCGR